MRPYFIVHIVLKLAFTSHFKLCLHHKNNVFILRFVLFEPYCWNVKMKGRNQREKNTKSNSIFLFLNNNNIPSQFQMPSIAQKNFLLWQLATTTLLNYATMNGFWMHFNVFACSHKIIFRFHDICLYLCASRSNAEPINSLPTNLQYRIATYFPLCVFIVHYFCWWICESICSAYLWLSKEMQSGCFLY